MSFLKFMGPMKSVRLVSGMVMLMLAGVAVAQAPSQKPLMSRSGGGVKPNLVVTLDTSASMDFQHAPEYDFKIKTGSSSTVTVTFPNFSFYWMHPYDPGPGYYDGSFKGIVPANPYRGTNANSMLFQMQMRSPDLNTIYYNPELRYDPWIKADGSRMPASPPTAAPYIPMMPALTRTDGRPVAANLTTSPEAVAANAAISPLASGTSTTAALAGKTVKWCGIFNGATNTPTCTTTAESYYPMLYYRLKKNASGYFLDPSDFRNYTFVDINGMQSGSSKGTGSAAAWTGLVTLTSFPKYPARTDCGTVTDTVCTQAQERQNFANWFTYYRSRMLLSQGAIPEAFKDIGDTIRLGWGRIHKGSTSVDGANSSIVERGVRDLDPVNTSGGTREKFINWLRNHPGNTDPDATINYTTTGGTPLIEAVTGVGEYFKRADNGGPWSDNPATLDAAAHKTCRRAYNMLITDGYYSNASPGVGNVDGVDGPTIDSVPTYTPAAPYKDSNSNTLADVAMKYWSQDLRGATGTALANKVSATAEDPAYWQHMTNYMIGLGVNGTLDPVTDWPKLVAGPPTGISWPATTGAGRIDDLWHAAVNSRGAYYSVKTPKELTDGVKAALVPVTERELRESGVATAAVTLQDGNRKYVPFYKTGSWYGDIQAFALDANGVAGAQQWSAESKLPIAASRNIYTWSNEAAGAVPFTWATMGATNQAALGPVGVTYGDSLVKYLRGDRSMEGSGQPFRVRKHVLGDYVNSNPVLLKSSVNMGYGTLPAAQGGGGTFTSGTPTVPTVNYAEFLAYKATRTAALFVGANDGMVHAFKDSLTTPVTAGDGEEIFAYVPKTVYPNLSKLSDTNYGVTAALFHQFYVDGPLIEADAYVKAPSDTTPSWRNYVLGSLGVGGRAVFALDVTNSPNLNASAVRWELNNAANADLGYVSAPIEVGVLPNGEWVAIFGNGAYSDAGKATLFVVNLETGSAQTLDVDTAGGNGLGGVGVVRNGTGQITTLYAGDLKGMMWKFDYLASATSRFEISGGSAFFAATHSDGVAQPISQAPLIFDHSLGGKMVLFGTGSLLTETDANSSAVQATYGVWDKPGDSAPFTRPMGRSLLRARTLTQTTAGDGSIYYSLGDPTVPANKIDWVTQRGWVMDLSPISGLRVVSPLQKVSSKIALVGAVAPAQNVVSCDEADGAGINLLFPVEDGLNPTYPFFDFNGDGFINSSDTIVAGWATKADGIDAIVRGTASCSGNICKTKISFQNTSGQKIGVIQENTSSSRTLKDRVWRRIINPPIR